MQMILPFLGFVNWIVFVPNSPLDLVAMKRINLLRILGGWQGCTVTVGAVQGKLAHPASRESEGAKVATLDEINIAKSILLASVLLRGVAESGPAVPCCATIRLWPQCTLVRKTMGKLAENITMRLGSERECWKSGVPKSIIEIVKNPPSIARKDHARSTNTLHVHVRQSITIDAQVFIGFLVLKESCCNNKAVDETKNCCAKPEWMEIFGLVHVKQMQMLINLVVEIRSKRSIDR